MRFKLISVFSMLLLFGLLVGCSQEQRAAAPNTDNLEQSFEQAGLNDVDVNADNEQRVLRLTGDVRSAAAKEQAEEMAKNAAPGYTVANEILVKPAGEMGDRAENMADNTDDAIESHLKAAMAKLQWTEKQDVDFDVNNGVVTLKGDVNTQNQRSQVAEVAKDVPGVKQVVNEIKIQGRTTTASE